MIDEMFIDKAVSGKSTDRPEYDKMMDYVKINDIDMIIVYKMIEYIEVYIICSNDL